MDYVKRVQVDLSSIAVSVQERIGGDSDFFDEQVARANRLAELLFSSGVEMPHGVTRTDMRWVLLRNIRVK